MNTQLLLRAGEGEHASPCRLQYMKVATSDRGCLKQKADTWKGGNHPNTPHVPCAVTHKKRFKSSMKITSCVSEDDVTCFEVPSEISSWDVWKHAMLTGSTWPEKKKKKNTLPSDKSNSTRVQHSTGHSREAALNLCSQGMQSKPPAAHHSTSRDEGLCLWGYWPGSRCHWG